MQNWFDVGVFLIAPTYATMWYVTYCPPAAHDQAYSTAQVKFAREAAQAISVP